MINLPKIFKPMLAATLEAGDYHKLNFPLIAQPKLDGIRCIIDADGVAYSRTLKPIPNLFVQDFFKRNVDYYALTEGELVADTFKRTTEIVMSRTGGTKGLEYVVFDNLDCKDDLCSYRMREVDFLLEMTDDVIKVSTCPSTVVLNEGQLDATFEGMLITGYEGMMLRHPDKPYKYGRSTVKSQHLLKVKRFHDAEAIITGYTEELRNNNPAVKNAVGATERCTKAEGKEGTGKLGAFTVRAINGDFSGVSFKVGSGFTEEERRFLYDDKHVGRVITFKYQKEGGAAKPRFPTFKGFRV